MTGERFWDREAELDELVRYLDEGAHVSLLAPRRTGKSSLMLEAAKRLSDRFVCLNVDLQGARSAADAVAELGAATRDVESFWTKTKSVFAGVLGGAAESIETLQIEELKVTLRSGLTRGDWHMKGDRLFEVLAGAEKPAVLFLDEVPVLVNRLLKGDDYRITPERRSQADEFLSWLRANSIRHQDRVRLVIAGSIGLEPVLHQAGLSATMNHLTPFELRPWERETAIGCLAALSAEYELVLKLEAVEEMLERLGMWIPHHIEMYFDHLLRYCHRRKLGEVTKETAALVYEHSLLNIRGHVELSHMEERLKMVLGPELAPLAYSLLTEAAVTGRLTPEAASTLAADHLPESERRAQDHTEIQAILEHDGYLRPAPERCYVFQSKLIRDWWKRRFGHTYVPVAERWGGE